MSKKEEKKKDFINIAEMAEAFNLWCGVQPQLIELPLNTQALLLQAKAQMAMAQQLAIISKHLGEIVSKSKEVHAEKTAKSDN